MFNHYVTWDFIDSNKNESSFNEVKEAIEGLKDKIDGIIEISFNKTTISSTCDVVLISTFKSEDDYKIYATHPLHLEAGETLKKHFTNRHVIDFEL